MGTVVDPNVDEDVEIDLAADAAARSAVAGLNRGDAQGELAAARRLRAAVDALITEFVVDARESGVTWSEIGQALGVSTQAVHQKYRNAPNAR